MCFFLLNYTAEVLDKVIKLCVAGAKIIDICIAGDKAILEATSLVYNKKGKKKISKGNNNNILYCGWEIDLSFFFFDKYRYWFSYHRLCQQLCCSLQPSSLWPWIWSYLEGRWCCQDVSFLLQCMIDIGLNCFFQSIGCSIRWLLLYCCHYHCCWC